MKLKKQILISALVVAVFAGGLLVVVTQAYAEKDNNSFSDGFTQKETFKDSHFQEFDPNAAKNPVPPPPTTDGDPITSPVDGGLSLLVLGALGLLFLGKNKKK